MCYAALFGAFYVLLSLAALLLLAVFNFAFSVTTIICAGSQRYEVNRVIHKPITKSMLHVHVAHSIRLIWLIWTSPCLASPSL